MIVNWMLFQNLDCKLAADALGDYAIQGAEIAEADCNYSWPIKEQHWQENGGGCSCALWEFLLLWFTSWVLAGWASFCIRDVDLPT